ncbi:MAG TPA: YbaK/EbsC family protein [Spirochaetota bacterium]|nr:YbaK/EbsC family protein [Spirochaetota bacterium]
MRGEKIKKFLDRNHVHYETITHTPSFTAQGTAHSAHISGKEVVKTVILKVRDEMVMIALPANYKLNMDHMRNIFGTHEVELAHEEEFRDIFPDCEVGAMPPFGDLYGIDVFVADELTKDREIAFNAGTHTELIKLSFSDYDKLEHPRIIQLSSVLE